MCECVCVVVVFGCVHVCLCVARGCVDMCTYTFVSVYSEWWIQIYKYISNHTSAIEQFWQLLVILVRVLLEDKYQCL